MDSVEYLSPTALAILVTFLVTDALAFVLASWAAVRASVSSFDSVMVVGVVGRSLRGIHLLLLRLLVLLYW